MDGNIRDPQGPLQEDPSTTFEEKLRIAEADATVQLYPCVVVVVDHGVLDSIKLFEWESGAIKWLKENHVERLEKWLKEDNDYAFSTLQTLNRAAGNLEPQGGHGNWWDYWNDLYEAVGDPDIDITVLYEQEIVR